MQNIASSAFVYPGEYQAITRVMCMMFAVGMAITTKIRQFIHCVCKLHKRISNNLEVISYLSTLTGHFVGYACSAAH